MNCPKCATANPIEARFCMNCGSALRASDASAGAQRGGEPAPRSAAGDGFLNRYLPPELMRKLEAARSQGGLAGERRVITMLFCDVKGSTAAAEKVDPEIWSDIMNGAFERMIGPIYKYEGTVPRLMGDAILAFFGAPIAHEDDPQRAVRAGLEIQAALRPYAAEVREQHGLEFGLRVGINTGLVVVGEFGSDLRMEYTAIGDAINLAARMEQTARPGTVQITEETYKLVAPLFEFEPLGGIEAKGKAEPVIAYRVIGPRSQPGHLRGLQGLNSPLVGRQEQLGMLRQCLAQLARGTGGFLAILGEAGLGKSSLIAEAQRAGGGQAWLKGEALSYARSVSYFPWRQIVRGSIEAREEDEPTEVRGKLRAQCADNNLPGEDIAFLEAMLAVESDESSNALAAYQGEALRQRMTEAVRQYLCGLASEQPLALVFDDLHWADEASLALLLNVVDLANTQPLLFLCMLRPDKDAPSWSTMQEVRTKLGSNCHSIELAPLPSNQTEELLANLLGQHALPPELLQLIVDKAGGNPFFVEELIRSLIDAGQIVRTDGRWRPARDAASVMLPDTLRGVLRARIDRLSEPNQHVLQMASVVGRTFELRVLDRLARVDDLPVHMSELVEAGLMEPGGREGTFRHVLIQEAAYDSILIKRRPELHRQVAEALEELHAGRTPELASVLAHHFHLAGDERSLAYDVLAGDKSAGLYANSEAVFHYRRALDTARRASSDEALAADLLSKLGSVLELSGRYAEAVEAYDEMQALGSEHGDARVEMKALMAKATIYSTPTALRDPARGEEAMKRALELSEVIGDLGVQTKLSWNLMLNYLHARRLAPAYEHGRRALMLARQGTDPEQLAFVLNDLGRVLVCRGDFEGAFQVIHEARELWTSSGNRVMLADNLGAESEALLSMGRLEQVVQISERALRLCEELNNAWGKSYHRLLSGLAEFARGRLGRAMYLIESGIELGDQGGLIISTIAGRCDLAWLYGWCGAIDRGLDIIRPAAESARAYLPDWLAMPGAVEVRLHALRGDLAAAERAVAGIDLQPPSLPYPHYTMMVRMGQIRLAQLRSDHAGALRIGESTREELETTLPGEMPALLESEAQDLIAIGRPEEARQRLVEARAAADAMGARAALLPILSHLTEVEREPEAQRDRERARQLIEEMYESLHESLREGFRDLWRPKVQ